MRVEPKALVRRLNPATTRMLEAAVGAAASGQFYEITCEHLLLKILEADDGDAHHILQHYGQRRPVLIQRVQRSLERMKTGNGGRPVFSESLFQWVEDAWVVASLTYGATTLRSGHLLMQFIDLGSRYSGENFAELEAISVGELRKQFEDITARSPEVPQAAPADARAGGEAQGGPAAPAGEEAIKRFTTSFTDDAKAGKIDPIFGRHAEIRQLIDILGRRRKNNPVIVGEPGVGKSALVEGLALAIVSGDVPDMLKDVDLRGLDLGALQAGASVKGEFEKRLKGVINEVKGSARKIVLFIDEAHTLIGAGGGPGNDAANLLKPALARGELRTIAATTWSEYKKFFEKDAALERRFQMVKVDEPSQENAAVMLRGIRKIYEAAHGVTIRDEAVVAAVTLSARYIAGRQLPDKAIDLLDTAAATVKIEQRTKPPELVALDNELASLERTKEAQGRDITDGANVDLERHSELLARIDVVRGQAEALRTRWEAERAAVEELTKARQAVRDAKPDTDNAVLEGLNQALAAAGEALHAIVGEGSPLIHTEVDADVVARVVERWTGVPAGKMAASTIGAVLRLEDELAARVRGQDSAMKVVAETVRMSHAGVRDPNTPIGVLLFVGPSGVGKTETALALADLLYGGERFVTSINMSEFQEKHTVSRLVGSPPGYVGYGEGGVLTEAVRQRPYSVVLLDECEKADIDVMNLFYQVFDKGVLNDGEGRAIDFKNTVVILTSNLASAEIMALHARETPPSASEVTEAIRPILSKHFKPALLARMTVVPYGSISAPILRDITRQKLGKLAKRLQQSHRLAVEFAPELVEELARRCTDPGSGARNVDHILRSSLMPELARTLLERLAEDALPGRLRVDLSPAGGWRFDFDEA